MYRTTHPMPTVRRLVVTACLAFTTTPAVPSLDAQTTGASTMRASNDSTFRRRFVGSSAFVLANAFPDPPSFYQLNLGYRLTRKDAISLEAITWMYREPLGIPYGPNKFAKSKLQEYPGRVRGSGVGVAYQHLFWKGLYAQAHALPLWQRYSDRNGKKIQDGFQLFTTLRTGYQVKLRSDRWFIEPSVSVTAWPINTNVPPAFAAADKNWNRYFLFEPGLHFGRRF